MTSAGANRKTQGCAFPADGAEARALDEKSDVGVGDAVAARRGNVESASPRRFGRHGNGHRRRLTERGRHAPP